MGFSQNDDSGRNGIITNTLVNIMKHILEIHLGSYMALLAPAAISQGNCTLVKGERDWERGDQSAGSC